MSESVSEYSDDDSCELYRTHGDMVLVHTHYILVDRDTANVPIAWKCK